MTKAVSGFRAWVYNLWRENWEERLTYRETPVNIREYWQEYKFWLKREYRHQRQQQRLTERQRENHASRLRNYTVVRSKDPT